MPAMRHPELPEIEEVPVLPEPDSDTDVAYDPLKQLISINGRSASSLRNSLARLYPARPVPMMTRGALSDTWHLLQ